MAKAKYKVWLTVKDSYGNTKELDGGNVDINLDEETVDTIVDSIKDISLVISAYINNGSENKYIQNNGMSDTVSGISYNEAKEFKQ